MTKKTKIEHVFKVLPAFGFAIGFIKDKTEMYHNTEDEYIFFIGFLCFTFSVCLTITKYEND